MGTGSSMKYREQEVLAIVRLAFLTVGMSILMAIALLYPERTANIVRHLPIQRAGNDYAVFLGVLGVLVPLSWIMVLILLFTSPEQEVRFGRWTRRCRKTSYPIEAIEFDVRDPDYRKASWRYLLTRSKKAGTP